MSRDGAIQEARRYVTEGRFLEDLKRRVAYPTESQIPERFDTLRAYLIDELTPSLKRLGYSCEILENSTHPTFPSILGIRDEEPSLPTVLSYGHGDVVQGLAENWREGLDPWNVVVESDRIYGRGTADNKGQHTLLLGALEAVMEEEGRLGFNSKVLIDVGEEVGSKGLLETCQENVGKLKSDLFLSSDGPRLKQNQPTLFLGCRGLKNLDLVVNLRDGEHHSGNWGGVISDAGVVLSHALAQIIARDGRLLVPEWTPEEIPTAIREALADFELDAGPAAPELDHDWGEPGLSHAEKVFAWTSCTILAFVTGKPEAPVNSIQGYARATLQIRYTVDVEENDIIRSLRRHLDRNGFSMVEIVERPPLNCPASRLSPDDPYVLWAVESVERTVGQRPLVLPNAGGWIGNHIFTDVVGVPTIWVPHSYTGCFQHSANEHLLFPLVEEGAAIMAGLFWDFGFGDKPDVGSFHSDTS